MNKRRFFKVICLALLAIQCSSKPKKVTGQTPLPETEVRDVPYTARQPEEPPRHRVLIMPFLSKGTQKEQILEDSRRALVRELGATKRFVILDNRDLPKDLKTYMNAEGDFDLEAISKVAANMGIAAVIEGKVIDIRAKRLGDSVGMFRKVSAQVESEMRLRVAAARNGKEILNEMRSAVADTSTTQFMEDSFDEKSLTEDANLIRESVRKATVSSVANIVRAVEKLTWEGRIALISGERVFINAGRLSGLQIGDILKVTEDGEEVYDPETGRFIGTAPGRMKGTIELVSYFGKDGAIGIYHSGSGFKENDKVEIY